MAVNEKDNKDFEFIKEQVIEKKRKKIKKRLLSIVRTLLLAIMFGLAAAATFVVAEPYFCNLLNKNDRTKTPISFPTPSTGLQNSEVTKAPDDTNDMSDNQASGNEDSTGAEPTTYPVIERIDASLKDYAKMYDEIRKVSNEVDKSIVSITSTFTVVDWFNKTVNKTVDTTGVIVADNTADYLILVSLDRVHDANTIRLRFAETAYVDAVIQDYESELNLALLAVAKEDIPQLYLSNLRVAKLAETYSVVVGSPVIAKGSPNGHPGSMDIGIVTSKGSYAKITDNNLELFNTNMTDNSDSDGIIVNLKGEVVGIITRTLKENVNKEISTILGISKVKSYIEKMGNQQPRVCFGIKAEDLTENARQEHKVLNGIYVDEVLSDSPAFDAGVKRGDIILSINKSNVLNINNFYYTISSLQPDTVITVKIKRTSGSGGKEMDLKIVLSKKVQ